jgi:hypothetical protein
MTDQPSKERLEAEADPYSKSQQATPEAVASRQDAAGTARGARSAGMPPQAEQGSSAAGRRDGDPFDQSDQATDEAVQERARQSPSRLNEGDR